VNAEEHLKVLQEFRGFSQQPAGRLWITSAKSLLAQESDLIRQSCGRNRGFRILEPGGRLVQPLANRIQIPND
jgi:hypothetical protein